MSESKAVRLILFWEKAILTKELRHQWKPMCVNTPTLWLFGLPSLKLMWQVWAKVIFLAASSLWRLPVPLACELKKKGAPGTAIVLKDGIALLAGEGIDAQLIKKVEAYLPEHDTNGVELHLMWPEDATKFSLQRIGVSKDTISVTCNVLRDYFTDLFQFWSLVQVQKCLQWFH